MHTTHNSKRTRIADHASPRASLACCRHSQRLPPQERLQARRAHAMLRHLSNASVDLRRAVLRVAQQELVEERLRVSDPSLFFYFPRLARKLFNLAVFKLIAGIAPEATRDFQSCCCCFQLRARCLTLRTPCPSACAMGLPLALAPKSGFALDIAPTCCRLSNCLSKTLCPPSRLRIAQALTRRLAWISSARPPSSRKGRDLM